MAMPPEKSIFSLKMYKFNLKICIFNLKMYKFSLKMKFC